MKKIKFFAALLGLLFLDQSCNSPARSSEEPHKEIVAGKWKSFHIIEESGVLGKRVDLWRNQRLWYVANSGFLLSGFESRPGKHLWQGEHVGKWLHAATLDYQATGDKRLKLALDSVVNRLLATQLPNGYMGTYSENLRFYTVPDEPKGWDIWTHRYNLYGLLTYEKFHPDERIVKACRKIGDLLIQTYGKGEADITKYGTRKGMSSTTILESIVMLYDRTYEKKYLDFAEEIVNRSEQNPGLRLMGTLLNNESVVHPGDGKAYQLMSNLLGYLRLYEATGKEKYLQAVLNGWKQIDEKHILVTGGPWSRKTAYNANKECFANTDAFNPSEIVVENCCTVTWIQLNLQLFELTSQAKYADEAEKAMFNHLFSDQGTDGIDWCYYTKPNESSLPFVPDIHCCASSGPRALEMFSTYLAGQSENRISVNSFSPSKIDLTDQFGGGHLEIKSSFPFNTPAEIIFETGQPKSFTMEFRIPPGTSLAAVKVDRKPVKAKLNANGFYELTRDWKKGDVVTINMQYQLKLHVQEGENNRKWIAFSYGPLVLAQKITSKQEKQPFERFDVEGDREKIMNMVTRSGQSDSTIVFSIKNAGIELIPYYQATTMTSGPRTYFEVSSGSAEP